MKSQVGHVRQVRHGPRKKILSAQSPRPRARQHRLAGLSPRWQRQRHHLARARAGVALAGDGGRSPRRLAAAHLRQEVVDARPANLDGVVVHVHDAKREAIVALVERRAEGAVVDAVVVAVVSPKVVVATEHGRDAARRLVRSKHLQRLWVVPHHRCQRERNSGRRQP
eukprot:666588-Prymnesium_polylepis.1